MEELYKPAARVDRLVVQQVRDETLVYDIAAGRAYCLNSTAALVWHECTGSTTVTDIAERISNGRAEPDVVWLAIEQLAEFGLLKGTPDATRIRRARRRAIKSLALSALTLVPVVSSIATPKDNRSTMSVCVCTSTAQCLQPPCSGTCGPLGICV